MHQLGEKNFDDAGCQEDLRNGDGHAREGSDR